MRRHRVARGLFRVERARRDARAVRRGPKAVAKRAVRRTVWHVFLSRSAVPASRDPEPCTITPAPGLLSGPPLPPVRL